jgi:uncharacterized protein YjiS (DUF1127 family)
MIPKHGTASAPSSRSQIEADTKENQSMTLAVESQVRRAEWMPLRLLRASVWALRDRREQRATTRALSAMDDHLLKDIGVSRLEINFGRLQPSDA